jgi:hypothetical protein
MILILAAVPSQYSGPSTGRTPLTDLGGGAYQGFQGGRPRRGPGARG